MIDYNTLSDEAIHFLDANPSLTPIKRIHVKELKVNDEIWYENGSWGYRVLSIINEEEEYNNVYYATKRIKFKILDYSGYCVKYDMDADEEDDDLYEEHFDDTEMNSSVILLQRSKLDTKIVNFKKVLAIAGLFAVTLVGLGLLNKDSK
jgi:hypothetical protein